jgi:hypothetical protein
MFIETITFTCVVDWVKKWSSLETAIAKIVEISTKKNINYKLKETACIYKNANQSKI